MMRSFCWYLSSNATHYIEVFFIPSSPDDHTWGQWKSTRWMFGSSRVSMSAAVVKAIIAMKPSGCFTSLRINWIPYFRKFGFPGLCPAELDPRLLCKNTWKINNCAWVTVESGYRETRTKYTFLPSPDFILTVFNYSW